MWRSTYTRLSLVALVACIIGTLIIAAILVGRRPRAESGGYPRLSSDERVPDVADGWYRYPGPQPVFTFDGPFPKMPDEVLIYEVILPPESVSEEYIRELAARHFEIPAHAQYYPQSLIASLIADTAKVRYDRLTGYVTMTTPEWGRATTRDPNDFPTPDEALQIATDYVVEHNLLPADAGEGRLSGGDIGASGIIQINWTYRIGGYATWGPGAPGIYVGLGPGGKVVRVTKRWPQCRPWKTAPIITPNEAFKMLNESDSVFIGSKGGDVQSIVLAYHCVPGERYLVPTYYFWIADDKGYAAVPAVRPEYIDRNPSPADPRHRHPAGPAHAP
ncbi:MAG TPA: hypothetical protein ENN81_07555 [Phycisphaerales bacterium]|nr:hypothetical protein [Phycisphaerales bacterium]